MRLADQTPVIVGVGEVTQRPANPGEGLEPLSLMEIALRRAEADAGARVPLLDALESLDVVNITSWRYRDPPRELTARMGLSPGRLAYHPAGGESPLRFLHDAALAIAQGVIEAAAVVGAEAQSAVTKAKRAGLDLPWTPFASEVPRMKSGVDQVHPAAVRLGVRAPMTVYPFYEQATSAAWGQTPREAQRESGALWARYAEVAARNPGAWSQYPPDPQTIVTPAPGNRLIAWPYTKLMVANPSVNQGAAVIVMSYARARAMGISADHMVFFGGGAAAIEPRDFMARDQFVRSHAQDAVLQQALRIAGGAGFDHMELYSCFPTVPKMARRTLGLDAGFCPTVAGGLTFHGAPLNNYMSHATCAMVRLLRDGGGQGLLYGQGEFVTKHHALILTAQPAGALADYLVQGEADARRGPIPPVIEDVEGSATVESYTVLYDREGAPTHGVVILAVQGGCRTIARVEATDGETMARLTSLDHSAVGMRGTVQQSGDSLCFTCAGSGKQVPAMAIGQGLSIDE